jgi:hypothetical protein
MTLKPNLYNNFKHIFFWFLQLHQQWSPNIQDHEVQGDPEEEEQNCGHRPEHDLQHRVEKC